MIPCPPLSYPLTLFTKRTIFYSLRGHEIVHVITRLWKEHISKQEHNQGIHTGNEQMHEDDVDHDDMDDDKDEFDLGGSTFRQNVTFKEVDLNNVQLKDDLETPGSNLWDMKKEAPRQNKAVRKTYQKRIKPKKAEFNPWRELDRVSKKTMSRRDMLRGVFTWVWDG
jgi:hypothetical protein